MAAPAASPAAPKYTPIVTDAVRLVRVLFSPGAVFAEIAERPTFWMPWLVVSIVYAVIQFLQRPFQARLRELILERANRPAPPASSLSAIIGFVLTPVGVLLLVVISAGILFALASAMGGETTYKKMLTVVIFAWPVTLIQALVTYIVLTMRGVASITGPLDLVVSLGADNLLSADTHISYFMRFFLAGIGPLAIWGLAISAVGLMVLGKVGKTQAWIAATLAYFIGLVVGAGVGSFSMKFAGG